MNEFSHSLLNKRLEQFITVFCVILWAVVIWWIAFGRWMPRARYGVAFLGLILIIYIAGEFIKEFENESRLHLILLSLSTIVTLITTGYLFYEFDTLYEFRVGFAYTHEYWLAYTFTMVMIYVTWRAFGKTFLAVLLAGLFYGYFGFLFPGIIGHGGLSHTRLMLILVLEIEGFYGFLTRLVAAWIAPFLLYAGLMQAYGAFDLMFRAAAKSADYIDSGVAQTAVIASTVIGSINGSQTANAGMTGAFTIPLMKKNGMKGSTAGGIEAVASTLGQVLPPVMGAGAFVMATLVPGISYVDVLIAGLLPAIILVIAVAIAVHYSSVNQLDAAVEIDAIEGTLSTRKKITEILRFGIPFVILIWTLGILQYTVMTAALYTAVSMLITGFAFPLIERLWATKSGREVADQARGTFWDTIDGMRIGALALAPIAIILAAINGVVDILVTTGVPDIVTLYLMSLSQGVLLFAAILAMIICIILGLGMPTTAAYTIVALLVAPGLIGQFGLTHLSAHFFVFYAAILAGLTPPIATCAAVASGIAEADFWETCWEALKISAPLFIIPFAFVYHPTLVDGELTVATLTLGTIILIGAISIAYGINYRFRYRRAFAWSFRSLYIVLGVIAIVHPGNLPRYAAIVGIGLLFIVQKSARVSKLELLSTTEGPEDRVMTESEND